MLGPLEVICDAPPYPIVQACNAIGIDMPEDVAWHRGRANATHCDCNPSKRLLLAKYRFTYCDGSEVTYWVGQCGRCRKVYWQEA